MSETQTVITITDPSWNAEDQEWLEYQINDYLGRIIPTHLFTVEEFSK